MEDKDLVNVVPQNQKDEGILLSIIEIGRAHV